MEIVIYLNRFNLKLVYETCSNRVHDPEPAKSTLIRGGFCYITVSLFMQHIGMLRETEQGEVLEVSPINVADILTEIDNMQNSKQTFPWLSAVDPYGCTVLNRHQILPIISELQAIKGASGLTDVVKIKIDEACAFMKTIENASHEYIRLSGD